MQSLNKNGMSIAVFVLTVSQVAHNKGSAARQESNQQSAIYSSVRYMSVKKNLLPNKTSGQWHIEMRLMNNMKIMKPKRRFLCIK
jgi:hypothetical protein